MTSSPPIVQSPSDTTAFLTDLLTRLASDKQLPKYQFERRIDVFLTMFLPEILAKHPDFGWDVQLVAPEFPLKKAGRSMHSTNVDHLLFRHASATASASWVFFELKTDQESVRVDQLVTYLHATQRTMRDLRDDLRLIHRASKHGRKYRDLSQRVDAFKFSLDLPIELVYLAPDVELLPLSKALAMAYPNNIQARKAAGEAVSMLDFAALRTLDLQQYPQAWALFHDHILPYID